MSGTKPHLASITLMRVPGASRRTSAPRASCRPPPKATPCTAAITGTAKLRQPMATNCGLLAEPCVRGNKRSCALAVPSDVCAMPAKRPVSSPAQKALPSPYSTTARKPGVACS